MPIVGIVGIVGIVDVRLHPTVDQWLTAGGYTVWTSCGWIVATSTASVCNVRCYRYVATYIAAYT
jgi:hypothetical protein